MRILKLSTDLQQKKEKETEKMWKFVFVTEGSFPHTGNYIIT